MWCNQIYMENGLWHLKLKWSYPENRLENLSQVLWTDLQIFSLFVTKVISLKNIYINVFSAHLECSIVRKAKLNANSVHRELSQIIKVKFTVISVIKANSQQKVRTSVSRVLKLVTIHSWEKVGVWTVLPIAGRWTQLRTIYRSVSVISDNRGNRKEKCATDVCLMLSVQEHLKKSRLCLSRAIKSTSKNHSNCTNAYLIDVRVKAKTLAGKISLIFFAEIVNTTFLIQVQDVKSAHTRTKYSEYLR